MSIMKCTECSSADTVASTTERMDKKGRMFYLPCWFCEDCYHEEPVTLSDAEEWLTCYYDNMPSDIQPKPKPIRSPGQL